MLSMKGGAMECKNMMDVLENLNSIKAKLKSMGAWNSFKSILEPTILFVGESKEIKKEKEGGQTWNQRKIRI